MVLSHAQMRINSNILKIMATFGTAALSMVCAAAPVLAASQDATSAAAESVLGSQAARFMDESQKPRFKRETKPEIVTEEEKKPVEDDSGPTFLVKKIIFEGNTIIPPAELTKITAPFEGKELTFGKIKSIAEKITAYYRSKGYLTSRAYIPPQKMKDGAVTIKIIEGKVGKVSVEDNKYFSKKNYVDAMRMKEGRILRYQDLESNLYFLNQRNPDRQAKAYLSPGEGFGTSDIILKAEETWPVHLFYNFNNRGTKFTNLARNGPGFSLTNATGNADILTGIASYGESGSFAGYSVGYSLPFEKTGTTLNLDGNYVASQILGDLQPLGVTGLAWGINVGISQIFYQDIGLTVEGLVGFEIQDSKTLQRGLKLSFDRMRVFKAGPRLTFRDEGGRTFLEGMIKQGIPGFLAGSEDPDPSTSVPGSSGEFTFFTASVMRLQRLPWSSYLFLKADGQFTGDTLTALEQYRQGGAFSVRGYPESDSLGDYGDNFSIELGVPVPIFPLDMTVPFIKNRKWGDAVHIDGFLDGGNTFINERNTNIGTVKRRFLLGTGFGVRVDFDDTASLRFDYGFPVGNPSTDKNRPRVHISLTSGF